MNKEQETLAVEILKILKKEGGSTFKHQLKAQYSERETVISLLNDLDLIDFIGQTNEHIRLTEKGYQFESFEKLNKESRLQIDLAESNIEANKVNAKNSKFNRIATVINVIVGIINLSIILWQIFK